MFVDTWMHIPPRLQNDKHVEDLVYDRDMQFDVLADHAARIGRTFTMFTFGGQT